MPLYVNARQLFEADILCWVLIICDSVVVDRGRTVIWLSLVSSCRDTIENGGVGS